MNKKAFLALLLALIIPLTCYFVIKQFSSETVQMPRRFFSDSTEVDTVRGKLYSDTTWHKVPDFTFTNQLGQQVSMSDLKYVKNGDTLNKIIVADFFFTHCPTICPGMTSNMRKLQTSIKKAQRVGNTTPDFIHFISFSIDPERDSVQQLKKWADRFQINPEMWWLLTGDRKQIYDLSLNEMKLIAVDGEGVDTNFIHTDKFVLIDGDRVIRGYYNGLDSISLARLSNDIIFLSLEKNRSKKSFFSGKLELIAVVFLLTLVGLGLFLLVLRKTKNQN